MIFGSIEIFFSKSLYILGGLSEVEAALSSLFSNTITSAFLTKLPAEPIYITRDNSNLASFFSDSNAGYFVAGNGGNSIDPLS